MAPAKFSRSCLSRTCLAAAIGLALVNAAAGQSADMRTCTDGSGAEKIAACSRAIERKSTSAKDRETAFNERANGYQDQGDSDRAIADFSAAIKINPRNADLYLARGEAWRGKSDFDKALADYDQAIRHDSKNYVHYLIRGFAYHDRNECGRAIPDFDRAVALAPDEHRPFTLRGICKNNLGDVAGAIADHSKSIEKNAKETNSWFFRGELLHNKGDYDGTIRDMTAAVRNDPKSSSSWYFRGSAYQQKGEFQRARADYDKVIEIDSNDASVYYQRGLVRARLNDRNGAISDFRKSASIKPDKDVSEALARLESEAAAQNVASPAPRTSPVTGAGPRTALVIGNGNYQHASKLANPVNDAADVGKTLRDLGFDVVEGRDLDRRGMDDIVRQFARKLDGAKLALFFYAGHSLQVNGRNYLIPIDAKVEKQADLPLDTIDVGRVIEQMEADRRVNLIFLDACRDNPLTRSLARASQGATRSVSVQQGLAPIQSAAGTLIAFSTQPDNVALDGTGRNSPFTTALLKHLPTPGLEVETLMKQVRVDVIAATQEKQVPWGHSSLVGDVYLRPR